MTRTTLALLAALLLAAPAQAAPVLSVQDEAAITCNYWGLRAAALDAARDLGAKVVRINLIEWNACPASATAAHAIHAAGMRPQVSLVGSRAWLAGQIRRDRDIVSTYSIWNEPDLIAWHCCKNHMLPLGPTLGDPAAYRHAYVRGYRLVKRLDPGAKVLFGELSPHGMGRAGEGRWLSKVLRGGRLHADGIAVHPYHWHWSPRVNRSFLRELKGFKRAVRRYAKRGLLTTPKGGQVPVYNTEYGQPRSDGLSGDAAASARAYRYSRRLGFRQHNQYMIFPAFHPDHSMHVWNTAATSNGCRPGALYFKLRRAVTGRTDRNTHVAWPDCPEPIPGVTPPMPPGYGTPGYRTPY